MGTDWPVNIPMHVPSVAWSKSVLLNVVAIRSGSGFQPNLRVSDLATVQRSPATWLLHAQRAGWLAFWGTPGDSYSSSRGQIIRIPHVFL